MVRLALTPLRYVAGLVREAVILYRDVRGILTLDQKPPR